MSFASHADLVPGHVSRELSKVSTLTALIRSANYFASKMSMKCLLCVGILTHSAGRLELLDLAVERLNYSSGT